MSHRVAHQNQRPQTPHPAPAGERTDEPPPGERPELADDLRTRSATVDRGTALLAAATCLLFVVCVSVISHSAAAAMIATACMVAGIAAVLAILRPQC
ncbi:MAG: hypothetical protein HOQ36_02040 [Nocardia sp.]|nr:hypothetical protein [Nocardia sp.]NUS91182.1 hypothetical protein [Nocardia sp.]